MAIGNAVETQVFIAGSRSFRRNLYLRRPVIYDTVMLYHNKLNIHERKPWIRPMVMTNSCTDELILRWRKSNFTYGISK